MSSAEGLRTAAGECREPIDGGNRYHAELPTNAVAAVGLRIELDANGNRMTYTLAPAFTVGDVAQLPRRRP